MSSCLLHIELLELHSNTTAMLLHVFNLKEQCSFLLMPANGHTLFTDAVHRSSGKANLSDGTFHLNS